jgi:hypothetical protein
MAFVTQRKPAVALGLMALFLGSAISASAVEPVRLSGSIGGKVQSATGVGQMGATVILYNRYDRAVEQVMTNVDGGFVFNSLMPDLYSIRVSLSSFIPAFKRNISVKPGFHSMLTINMASMLSSIELISTGPAKGSLMSEDWMWVLRSSQATRPVLRYSDLTKEPQTRPGGSVFSETKGLLRVSAGDATSFTNSNQADLGTAFAVATSFLGTNQLEVTGNFGVSAQTGLPVAGFRSKYVRGGGRTPELTIGMHQIYLPARGGFGTRMDGAPAMRAVSATILDELMLGDRIRFEYGTSAESVSLLNRMNILSPFGRLSFDLGSGGTLRMAYSAGSAATDLAARLNSGGSKEDGTTLNRNLTALATVPRISLRDGQMRAQRTQNIEIGYSKVTRSRTYTAGAYRENVRDGSLMLAGSGTLYDGDVLPDLSSRSSIFNVGNFDRWGYLVSVSQSLAERFELGLAYGRGGTLSADNVELRSSQASDLRGMVRVRNRNWATARASATLPGTGTRVTGSYGWADFRSLMPAHLFLTQSFSQEPGVNISIRQPLPSFGGPGRFEATAELRNLLEHGYMPVTTADRRMMLLTNAPKAVRGGLSFIF